MIAIIDYGLGNIRAFVNIYKKLNVPLCIARQKEDLEGVKKIILPGVGAFDQAMQLFNRSGMRQPVEELVLGQKVPLLGFALACKSWPRAAKKVLKKD